MAAHPITLDPDLQERVERAARREVRSPEFLLRDALELYFNVHGETDEDQEAALQHDDLWDGFDDPPLTESQFLKEADESWKHYKETGLHVTQEEVSDWIRRLAIDPDAPPPQCHT